MRNYNFKDFIKYLLVFIGTIIMISLPFLILCPSDFLYWNLSQFSRFMTVSFGTAISDSFLFIPLIQFQIFSLNLLNLIQFSVVIISFLFFINRFNIHFIKREKWILKFTKISKKRFKFFESHFFCFFPIDITLSLPL